MACLDRLIQRLFIDEPSSSRVDNEGSRLHLGKGRTIDDMLGFFSERGVKRDEMGAGKELLQSHPFYAQNRCCFRGDLGIMGKNLHAHSDSPVGHNGTDLAQTDDAQGLLVEFCSHETSFFP